VRVDLFAPDEDGRRVARCAEALDALVAAGDGGPRGFGVDQGVGVEGRPVIGMTFWVRADDVGSAALTAVDLARRAGEPEGVGPGLYDVVVIPADAVSAPNDPCYPAMPD
jgi:hypothetical protein